MFDLVIGIIHHSRQDLTLKCLKSIRSNKYNIKICLIDNNPSDYINFNLRSSFPNIDIIINKEINGFAKNQNKMIRKYIDKTKYFMSLNNDAILKNNTIDEMLDFAKSHSCLGAVCPSMVDANQNPLASCGPVPGFLTHFLRIIKISKILNFKIIKIVLSNALIFIPIMKEYFQASKGYSESQEVPRISGACVIFSKTALKDVGLYDEQFFMYSEDSDWSIRAKKIGYKLYITTEAKVFHQVSASSNLRSLYEMENSMFKYFKKHFPKNIMKKKIISFTLIIRHFLSLTISYSLNRSSEIKSFHRNNINLSIKHFFNN